MRLRSLLGFFGIWLGLAACDREPCRAQRDCPSGSYCVLSSASGGVSGTCERDCVSNADCSLVSTDDLSRFNLCDNEGRCTVRTRPPHLRIFDPENDTLLPGGTRSVSLSGTVGTAAPGVLITVRPSVSGCSISQGQTLSLVHPEPGRYLELPFLLEDVRLDPGVSAVNIAASIDGARKELTHYLEVPCPGCAQVTVTEPSESATAGFLLPRLAGTVSPDITRTAAWRVRSSEGELIDGRLDVVEGRFSAERLPLFPGANQVEVVVAGASVESESRCSRTVTTPSARERGLRVLLSWESQTSDLDLHIVLPGGRLGDPSSSVYPSHEQLSVRGAVDDALSGPGPEVGTVELLSDGVYGFVVVPVFDTGSFGTSAFLRVLHDGRLLVRGPVGPAFLSPFDDALWVVGKLVVAAGQATWVEIDQLVSRTVPLSTTPAEWPERYHD